MKKYGRAFNHLEDLTFFYGSLGIEEAINHMIEISNHPGTLRMKWDGCCQVYWGREYDNGPLIMAGHNGWARGVKSTTIDEVYDFIANKSGKKSTERDDFARIFSNMLPYLDELTPPEKNFYYADVLTLKTPEPVFNDYIITPNGKTSYGFPESGNIGKLFKNGLQYLLVGHGSFDEFGLQDDQQKILDKFPINENCKEMYIIQPYYNNMYPILNETLLYNLVNIFLNNSAMIDELLEPIPGVSNYKNYFYKYTNYKAKRRELDFSLGDDFIYWLGDEEKISNNQKNKIISRISKNPFSLTIMFKIYLYIINIKNKLISTCDYNTKFEQISVTNNEGWVRYSGDNKQFGNIKLVPRHEWLP